MVDSHVIRMLPTQDGRQLEVPDQRPAGGFPLVFHYWIPGAAVPFDILDRAAAIVGCA